MQIILAPDVLFILCEQLGAREFLRASCCRGWLSAANSLPPNHKLWQAACEAESPLLVSMLGTDISWKARIKQRRQARVVSAGPSCFGHGISTYTLAFELIHKSTNSILRAGAQALQHFDRPQVCQFAFEPLVLSQFEPPSDARGAVPFEQLRLNLYLSQGHRLCCLALAALNDGDYYSPWYIFDCVFTEFNVKLRWRPQDASSDINADPNYEYDEANSLEVDVNLDGDGQDIGRLLQALESVEMRHLWAHADD